MKMSQDTQNQRPGLLIVRRIYFEQFAAGTKTIEYRRHRGQFTVRNFWVGRQVRIAFRYDFEAAGLPFLISQIAFFRVELARGALLADMRETYPDLSEGDEIVLIKLRLLERHRR